MLHGRFSVDQSKVQDGEAQRLAALDRLDVLDSPSEETFDRLARLTQIILDVPIALVSMIDAHRQWYKAACGLPRGEVERRLAFCQHAILDKKPLVVNDAREDPRFADHPLVTGEPHVRFYAGVPLRTRDGQNIGTLCAVGFEPRELTFREAEILSMLGQTAMDALELREQARTDGLTSVLSRRACKEEASRAVALARRHNQALSCLVFDLDKLKSINDTHGHSGGDLALARIASEAKGLLRQSDLLGRLGGDEFAVFLPNTSGREALRVAEKLRSRIQSTVVVLGETSVKGTVSIGVAWLTKETHSVDELLANADAALYEAKARGRNRVASFQSEAQPERSARRRVLKAGRIVLNDRKSTIDCTVRSLASDSAGLDVTSAAGIPETFTLAIRSDKFEARCRVTAQTDKHLEVEFC
jgi:diguanylate cyclase (GGDEF)-like protein